MSVLAEGMPLGAPQTNTSPMEQPVLQLVPNAQPGLSEIRPAPGQSEVTKIEKLGTLIAKANQDVSFPSRNRRRPGAFHRSRHTKVGWGPYTTPEQFELMEEIVAKKEAEREETTWQPGIGQIALQLH